MRSFYSSNMYVFARECMDRYIVVRLRKLIGVFDFRLHPKWTVFIREHGNTLQNWKHRTRMKKYK